MNALFEAFAQGMIIHRAECSAAEPFPWNAHQSFAGVFLKNLIAREGTDGMLSCHLVRIDPNCSIGLHSHPDSIELHEVIAGSGACMLQKQTFSYSPGTMNLIACGVPHEVHAGQDGLCLFAKFISLYPRPPL